MPARLEALDLSSEGKLSWSVGLERPTWGDEWTFGGPPVADGGKLYVSALKRGPLRIESHVAALDPADGRLLWRRMVCAAEPFFSDQAALVAQQLLSVGPGVIYVNTNLGAVAALDAEHGNVIWLTSYPRRYLEHADADRNDLHFYRDMNPCLVARGLVIAAPADSNRLMALDATTGIPIWVTRAEVGADIVHLLGSSGNQLIASGECLYWFDLDDGEFVAQYPGGFDPTPGFARPSPRGRGRGVLAGEHVYWPTSDAILVFPQRPARSAYGKTAAPVREISLAEHGARGGHLAVGRDVLLIAAADRLWAFGL
jgi:outer membrane protein assembly factor BamB